MTTDAKKRKSREELALWSDSELFAFAITHGFGMGKDTRVAPGLKLTYSFCYGCGYSDTKFWEIPYALAETGLPVFEPAAKETLHMLIAGEHLTAWNKLLALKEAENEARKEHHAFLAVTQTQ